MNDQSSSMSALRAVAHPLRLQILSLLTGAELSAAEVARELDLTHANASYHLRVLLQAGEIVEAGEERIRGGVAKKYRHHWQTEGPSSSNPKDGRLMVRAMADELVRRFDHRKPRTKSSLTDADMWVPPEVWQQVNEHLQAASELIHAEARPPRTDGTMHVNLTFAAFVMEDGS